MGQTELSDHGAGDVFEAIPGGRHHVIDFMPSGVEFVSVDPADSPRDWLMPELPDFGHYRRGWYDE